MKTLASFFLASAALLSVSWCQLPSGQAKPSSPAPKLTPKDIKVYRFALEFREQTFPMNDREMPDELRVTTVDKIHITGKKRVDDPARVRERMIANIGKVALIAPGDRTGKLTVKLPWADDVRYYFVTIEHADDTLDTQDLHLAPGKTYKWSVKTASHETALTIMDGDTEVVTITAPADKFKRFGFAATVRNQGNEADMVVTFD